MRIEGRFLGSFGTPFLIGIRVRATLGSVYSEGSCESDGDTLDCRGLRFEQPGVYKINLVVESANCDEIRSNLVLRAIEPIVDI